MDLKRELKHFTKPIKAEMKFSKRHKRIFYGNLEISARNYLQGHPNATTNELFTHLGEPRELLQSFKASMNPKEIQKAYRRSKRIIIGLSILGVLVVLLAAYLFIVFGPTNIDTYYLDAQGVYQLDENASRVYLESAPEGAPEFYYE